MRDHVRRRIAADAQIDGLSGQQVEGNLPGKPLKSDTASPGGEVGPECEIR